MTLVFGKQHLAGQRLAKFAAYAIREMAVTAGAAAPRLRRLRVDASTADEALATALHSSRHVVLIVPESDIPLLRMLTAAAAPDCTVVAVYAASWLPALAQRSPDAHGRVSAVIKSLGARALELERYPQDADLIERLCATLAEGLAPQGEAAAWQERTRAVVSRYAVQLLIEGSRAGSVQPSEGAAARVRAAGHFAECLGCGSASVHCGRRSRGQDHAAEAAAGPRRGSAGAAHIARAHRRQVDTGDPGPGLGALRLPGSTAM